MLHISSTILSKALSMTIANKPALRSITLEIVSLQLKLRMPPDVIFAFIKTGYVMTDENAATFSQTELEDWRRVRMEYFALAAEQADEQLLTQPISSTLRQQRGSGITDCPEQSTSILPLNCRE